MFNMFKSQTSLDLTPRTCLAVSLIYCMGADGEIDPEEIGHLMSVLGRNTTRQQLESAVKYAARPSRPSSWPTPRRACARTSGSASSST